MPRKGPIKELEVMLEQYVLYNMIEVEVYGKNLRKIQNKSFQYPKIFFRR